MTKKYEIIQNNNIVICKSNFRLPFEPKDFAKSYREEIRKILSNLQIQENQILKAKYITSNSDFFDVENILFYNVGTSYFRNICKNGFLMKYEFRDELKKDEYTHIIEYQIVAKDSELPLITRNILSEFQFDIKSLTTNNKVANYWFAMHSGTIELSKLNKPINDFGLSITVLTNKKIPNIVSLMKSLLDGIISGYHDEEKLDDDAIERLSKSLNSDKLKIEKYIQNKQFAVLGKRNLVSKYRNGVKWNPADEKCKEVIIIPKYSKNIKTPKIMGELYLINS